MQNPLHIRFLLVLVLAFGAKSVPQQIHARKPSLIVLSTLDGSVVGIDAFSGKELFAVPSDTPSLSSWARDGYP